jgi:hypothetical protein
MLWTDKKPGKGAALAIKVVPLPLPPGMSPELRSTPSKPEPMTPLVTRSSEALAKMFVTTWARVVVVVARNANTQTRRDIR